MIETIKTLSNICTYALENKFYNHPIENEKEFYKIAKENGLIGLIFDMLNPDVLSKEFIRHMQKDYFAYIASDVKQTDAISKLNLLFNQNQIKHIFLKGSRLKKIYPNSYMRGMGDIDILIHESDMKKVHELFKDQGIILESPSDAHDLFKMDQTITIEIHPKLYKDFNPKYEKLMKDPWHHTYLIENDEYGLNYEFEVVYLAYHLAKHLDASGIGLRSILDIGVYLDYYHNEIDLERLKKMLKDVNMESFFSHLVSINIIYFNFESLNPFIMTPSLSKERYDEIVLYFVESGIHGKGKNFNSFEARYSIHKMRKKKSLSFYISIFFPSYQSMKGMYPILKTTYKKLKQLNIRKEKVNQVTKIYQDLGL
ncbi:MAG: hypothetical protein CVV63_04260 [Tenericutes bacterium HGW-Tenericutes-8]|nr:MAG: hypothetical protein CVV63_04260 [Tenericutes bacterium HGW-Tenericutes-8]